MFVMDVLHFISHQISIPWLLPEAVVQMCSVKNVFLEISQNSQENTCARVSFLTKLQASVWNFIKEENLALVFSYEFYEVSKNTFFHRIPLVAASVLLSKLMIKIMKISPGFRGSTAILNPAEVFRRWCKLNFGLLRGHVKPRHITAQLPFYWKNKREKTIFLLFKCIWQVTTLNNPLTYWFGFIITF